MRYIFLFVWLLVFNSFAQKSETPLGDVYHIDSLPASGILLDKGWKWHAGDNPDFSKANFDDSKWENIDPTKDIMDLPQFRKAGIGWLRLNLHVDTTLLQQQAITFLVAQTAASELYSNGQLILRLGTVSPNADEVDAVSTIFHSFGLPGVGKSTYALAVRIAFQPNLPYTKFGNVPNSLYRVRVRAVSQLDPFSPLSQRRYNFLTYTFVKAGLFFILALLHLCFFIFYPLKKANLFFSISSLLFFLHWLVLGLRNTSLLSDLDTMMYVGQLRAVLFPVNYICLVTALYTAYALPKSFYYWAGVGACGLLIVIYFLNYQSGVPWIEIGSTIVMTAEAIRITVMAVVRKHRGVNIILIGLVFSFVGLSIRYLTEFTSLLPYFRINNYANTFDNFGVLSLPLFLSVYLASEFAFASKSLAAQLVAVKQLSAQTLAQEQEKQQILSTQNETLERQVAERTAELEHKNRDLEIEAALEKVRSRTMAMYKSEELAEVATLLYQQISQLGGMFDRFVIGIFDVPKGVVDIWATDQSGQQLNQRFIARLDEKTTFVKVYTGWKAGDRSQVIDLQGEELREWIRYAREELGIKINEEQLHGRRLQNVAYFSQGYLAIQSSEPLAPEIHMILERFATAFNLIYTRFLDLQKAEAQAREAIIEASLERVRAEIASMRTTEDLQSITPLIWKELTILKVPFIRCGVFIMDDVIEKVHTYLSTPDGNALASFHLPYNSEGNTPEVVAHWRNQQIFVDEWDEAQFRAWGQSLVKQGIIESDESYATATPPKHLCLHFIPFLQGMLYVGNTSPLTTDEVQVVQSLASAFSTAYARYQDFNQLEEAKQQVENAFKELKTTQTQLIQKEKLASLGELTAGIAHEIQNPLNFVNNFSELSIELLEELKQEASIGGLGAELLADISQNLGKINLHGKRASNIVSGMLEHSRTSSGERKLTDINKLSEEYLRLAYHGMRAKDKTFNSDFELIADENLPQINVVSQDIGRVLLNLINNAFQSPPPPNGGVNYCKKVTVSTQSLVPPLDGTPRGVRGLAVIVSDNGAGIPEAILPKIFQPFFTTKPPGEGTGLGLSLAYDIVTKGHGGTIEVESVEGEGTTFTVKLDITTA